MLLCTVCFYTGYRDRLVYPTSGAKIAQIFLLGDTETFFATQQHPIDHSIHNGEEEKSVRPR